MRPPGGLPQPPADAASSPGVPPADDPWLRRFHAGDREVIEDCYREHFATVERAPLKATSQRLALQQACPQLGNGRLPVRAAQHGPDGAFAGGEVLALAVLDHLAIAGVEPPQPRIVGRRYTRRAGGIGGRLR